MRNTPQAHGDRHDEHSTTDPQWEIRGMDLVRARMAGGSAPVALQFGGRQRSYPRKSEKAPGPPTLSTRTRDRSPADVREWRTQKREDKQQRRHHQAGSLATDMGTWEAPDRVTTRIAPDQRWPGLELESEWGQHQHNGMQDHSARGRCRHNTGKWEMGNANGKWEVRMEIAAGS